ncbi:hypothetical protein BDW74DRAFT_175047 [Aspergillus multicolor]|uniref:uncharacterized protein n=1 Tax=Aspergillus multicolor TaxID=41759 RepID=UPI003CCDD12B
MDPFAVIGLAGNIITFLNFGLNIVSKTQEIHGAVSGATADNENLTATTLRFQNMVSEIQKRNASRGLRNDDLTKLAAECIDVSDELQSLLQELKAKKRHSKTSSMRAAWRDWRNKNEKRSQEERLSRCRQELLLLLAISGR